MVMLTTCLGGMSETILGPVARMHPASWGKLVLFTVLLDSLRGRWRPGPGPECREYR